MKNKPFTFYFSIQWIRAQRALRALGLNPYLGVGIGILLFGIGTVYLFWKTTMAASIYLLFAGSVLLPLSEKDRNAFLSTQYATSIYRQIRLVENGLVIFPFLIGLLSYSHFVEAFLLMLAGSGMALFNIGPQLGKVIPTPFGKLPFEFPVGLRQYWLFFAITYGIIILGIVVQNANISLFGLIILMGLGLSLISLMEPFYFMWIHTHAAKEFLHYKVGILLKCLPILYLPGALALGIYDPSYLSLIVGVLFYGILCNVALLFGKYTAYPLPINIPQGLLLGFSIVIPPLLLILLPYFYRKAIQNLKTVYL